jgi:hypothetical protein
MINCVKGMDSLHTGHLMRRYAGEEMFVGRNVERNCIYVKS